MGKDRPTANRSANAKQVVHLLAHRDEYGLACEHASYFQRGCRAPYAKREQSEEGCNYSYSDWIVERDGPREAVNQRYRHGMGQSESKIKRHHVVALFRSCVDIL